MKEIVLSNVSKTYRPGLFKKRVKAVRDVSFDVTGGEVFGLIGPNGAGKSSTIRLLLGLSRPDEGEILFRGRQLAQSGIRREVGYLPENPYLYDHLTLKELLAFSGRASGCSAGEIAHTGKALMSKLDLAGVENRPLRTFSKGMLQRAGICFALLPDPSVVILDEPMSGLDPLGRNMVFDLVTELKESGKTIFFCSHILNDVERLCDRIGVMVAGRLARVLEQRDFLQDQEYRVHLRLPPLNGDQLAGLEELPGLLTREEGGYMLSVAAEGMLQAAERLQRLGVSNWATSSEHLSLEDLFIRIVEEQSCSEC